MIAGISRSSTRSSARSSACAIAAAALVAYLPLLGAARAQSDNAEQAFRARQSDLLKAQEPDRIRIDRAPEKPAETPSQDLDALSKPKPVSVSVSVSELAAAIEHNAKKQPGILDIWFEGHYRPYEINDSLAGLKDGSLSVIYAGTKYMLGPDIMVGALAQLDKSEELGNGLSGGASANGWMAGPYASVKFGHGIIFDGRAAWGNGEFDNGSTERRLVKGALRGAKQVGDWTVTPKLGVSYTEETAGGESGAQGAGQARVEVMPEVKRRFGLGESTFIEPRAAAGAFVAFDQLGSLSAAEQLEQKPDVHMKAEAGLALGVKDGVSVQASGGLETSGEAAAESWSGRFQLNMPLH
ncbi:MAG: autotransporter outer membrane beta-barrel domain-containing protein [Hyphomicrobium sp.]|jgi:hypothetical protein